MNPDEMDQLLRTAIEKDTRSITTLAIDAGIHQPSLSNYLMRKRSITWQTACRLLSALGMRIGRRKKATAKK